MKKLNKYVLLSCLLFLLTTCKKTFKITENINTIGTLYGSGAEHFVNEVLQTNDGNYLLGGTTLGGEQGKFDYYVMKVDAKFNTIWYKNFGGIYEDVFYSMAADEDGNIMLAGNSFSFGISLDSANGNISTLFYLVYIDKDGNTIWEKAFQSNKGKQNFDNRSKKILYVNNIFVVMGETNNYVFGGQNNYDVFGFCIDKQANIKWTRRFYSPFNTFEYCQNAIVSDDGNVIFQMRNDTNSYRMNLVKMLSTGSGVYLNKYVWSGPPILDFLDPGRTLTLNDPVYTILPMASCGGDKVCMPDLAKGSLTFTGNDGSVINRVSFKYPIDITNIRRENNTLVIIGTTKTAENYPAYILTDLDGNIRKEIYLNSTGLTHPKLLLAKAFMNSKNEISVFGTIETKTGSNIVMLKFDGEGNLIKK